MQESLLIESPDLNVVSAQDQLNQRTYFENQTYRAVELSLRQQQNPLKKNKRNGLNQKYRKLIPNMKMVKSHQVCTICLCNFQKGQIIKKLPCRHIYHRMCAKEWLKCNKKCAVCRMDLQEYFAIKEKALQNSKCQLPQLVSQIKIKKDEKEFQNLKKTQQPSNLNAKISKNG